MEKFLFAIFFFLSQVSCGQSSVIEIKTDSGTLTVNKSDNSLSVYGTLRISEKAAAEVIKSGMQNQKARLELMLSKNCNLSDILVKKQIPADSLNNELEQFASDLLNQVRIQNLEHIFQFDNELGFVNEDSCVDNLSVPVVLVK